MSVDTKPKPEKAVVPAAQRQVSIREPQFTQADFRRAVYAATILDDHTMEDVLRPEYWTNMASRLRPLDKLECYWEDGTRYAELLVVRPSRNDAVVTVLIDKSLTGAAQEYDLAAEIARFDITFGGAANGYRVIRKSDKQLMKDELATEDEARKWLFAHLSNPAQRAAPKKALEKAA